MAANHAFIDGNKRIGALMTQLLLQWNGYRLVLNRGELADMFPLLMVLLVKLNCWIGLTSVFIDKQDK